MPTELKTILKNNNVLLQKHFMWNFFELQSNSYIFRNTNTTTHDLHESPVVRNLVLFRMMNMSTFLKKTLCTVRTWYLRRCFRTERLQILGGSIRTRLYNVLAQESSSGPGEQDHGLNTEERRHSSLLWDRTHRKEVADIFVALRHKDNVFSCH